MIHNKLIRAVLFAALVAVTSACSGFISGPGDFGDNGNGGGDGDGPVLEAPDCSTVGPPMLRRLTARQLHNSLVRVFSDPNVPAGDVLTDPVVNGFKVDATEAVVRDLDTQQLMTYSERVADWAVQQKLGQLSPCQEQTDACFRSFVTDVGARIYRKPVPAETVEAYVGLFAAEPDFATGARVVLATMLQSPNFLYRSEIGEPDPSEPGMHRLTPLEIAENLAYTLTDFPPDQALLDAANQGRLATPADLEREVDRLLATPEAQDTLAHFAEGWLHYEDLPTRAKVDPTNRLTDETRQYMMQETRALFLHVVESGAPIGELLTANYTFVNSGLAQYYGLGGATGPNFERVELAGSNRAAGVLGHGSLLTRHALSDASSPVQRGVVVRERLLCQKLPPPPPDVDANLEPPVGVVTTRERYRQHSADPACAGCHELIDPVGFAFENYDTIGLYRDNEDGLPIDASGSLVEMPEGNIPLDGIDSLSSYLGQSTDVGTCFVQYISYYAYGLDGCNPDAVIAGAGGPMASVRDVIVSIVTAPHFTRRRPDE